MVGNGVIVRNKVRLVGQGYTQIEGVNYDMIFASLARLESIMLLLAITSLLKFKLYQNGCKKWLLEWNLN